MLYLKSFLTGVGALIAYLLFVTVVVRLLVRRPPDLPEGAGYVSSSPMVSAMARFACRAARFCRSLRLDVQKTVEGQPAARWILTRRLVRTSFGGFIRGVITTRMPS